MPAGPFSSGCAKPPAARLPSRSPDSGYGHWTDGRNHHQVGLVRLDLNGLDSFDSGHDTD